MSPSKKTSLWRSFPFDMFNEEALLWRPVCFCMPKGIQTEGSILQTMSWQGVLEWRPDNDKMHRLGQTSHIIIISINVM